MNLSVTEKPPVEVDRPHTFSVSGPHVHAQSANVHEYVSISHSLQWLALDLCSDSSMCHSELSSHTPINRENVGSVWETREQLRFSLHAFHSHTHYIE